MASETIKTGNTIHGDKYAQDSRGNIGYGTTESAALQALNVAQSRENSKK